MNLPFRQKKEVYKKSQLTNSLVFRKRNRPSWVILKEKKKEEKKKRRSRQAAEQQQQQTALLLGVALK